MRARRQCMGTSRGKRECSVKQSQCLLICRIYQIVSPDTTCPAEFIYSPVIDDTHHFGSVSFLQACMPALRVAVPICIPTVMDTMSKTKTTIIYRESRRIHFHIQLCCVAKKGAANMLVLRQYYYISTHYYVSPMYSRWSLVVGSGNFTTVTQRREGVRSPDVTCHLPPGLVDTSLYPHKGDNTVRHLMGYQSQMTVPCD